MDPQPHTTTLAVDEPVVDPARQSGESDYGLSGGGWAGPAAAFAVLVWALFAMRSARRVLGRDRKRNAGRPLRRPAGRDAVLDITIVAGERDEATLLHAGRGPGAPTTSLGAPGEAERQARAILRQIEGRPRPAAGRAADTPRRRGPFRGRGTPH